MNLWPFLVRQRASRGLNAESPPCPNSPGLTSRPANPSPLPRGSSFVVRPPTHREQVGTSPCFQRSLKLPQRPARCPASVVSLGGEGRARGPQYFFAEKMLGWVLGSALPVGAKIVEKAERRTSVWALSRKCAPRWAELGRNLSNQRRARAATEQVEGCLEGQRERRG